MIPPIKLILAVKARPIGVQDASPTATAIAPIAPSMNPPVKAPQKDSESSLLVAAPKQFITPLPSIPANTAQKLCPLESTFITGLFQQ